ncbi:MAG: hypothetical protein WAK82_40435 [Streptosporangiaceae bacterium]
MRQVQKDRRRRGRAGTRRDPLPADARDPDIVHAHQVTRRRAARDRRKG